ncbi:SRPBCC domain-containing protein [Micromonospora sp. NPDC000089]|uniref:SRPBCC family protein n=1 Tax=unclassified Micromonospora TaxID=2617518 RepID=UPI0036956352
MTSNTDTGTHDYQAVLDLPTDPRTVAELFTSAEGVSRWWGPTEGDATVGGVLVSDFGRYGVHTQRVREAGPDRVVWEPIVVPGTRPTEDTQEWLGTTIEIDIAPTDTGTRLRFRHAGLTPRLDCWDACSNGWAQFMASIESYARTGTGTPWGGGDA